MVFIYLVIIIHENEQIGIIKIREIGTITLLFCFISLYYFLSFFPDQASHLRSIHTPPRGTLSTTVSITNLGGAPAVLLTPGVALLAVAMALLTPAAPIAIATLTPGSRFRCLGR